MMTKTKTYEQKRKESTKKAKRIKALMEDPKRFNTPEGNHAAIVPESEREANDAGRGDDVLVRCGVGVGEDENRLQQALFSFKKWCAARHPSLVVFMLNTLPWT